MRLFDYLLSLTVFTFAATCSDVYAQDWHYIYDAEYHLGPVKVTAGRADMYISQDGENFSATLNGQSIPWRGRTYCINDTLQAVMPISNQDFTETVSYENGWYSKPKISSLENGKFDASDSDNYKTIFGRGKLNASDETMEAVTISADMLALFYYFRKIDFSKIQPGNSVKIPIAFSDGDIQHAVITYNGTSSYGNRTTYLVCIKYSYHGEMSNYPITCQIDRISRIPLIFSADLKIGHIELILNRS